MSSTIGHRLFGLGRIPRRLRDSLGVEGVRVLDEGIRVSVTYRNYRSPGKWFAWKRSTGSGAVVMTQRRLFVSFYRWPILDIERADSRLHRITMSVPATDVLELAFDAADLDSSRSGEVTIRLRTSQASTLRAMCEIRLEASGFRQYTDASETDARNHSSEGGRNEEVACAGSDDAASDCRRWGDRIRRRRSGSECRRRSL